MRHTLPQRATRHALLNEGGAHGLAGSSPVRRGIAVAAVVGGALSVAGAAVAVDRIPFAQDAPDDDLASIGLAADGEKVAAADPPAVDTPEPTTPSPVLDTDALADTVREANEEGKRLAEQRGSQDDSDVATTPRARIEPRSGRTASRFPAELIDTDEWNLTLPSGKEGSPDTVEGSNLATFHNKFFDLTKARDGIVFTANAGGVTTSGSSYPRSELREMNGAEKADWDANTGRHTMEIVQAITETPREKPDVIAGQIHDDQDDVMQIHLSGRRLTVKYADGQKDVVLDDAYKLGTKFTVKIEATKGHIKVWYNDAQKADLPITATNSYFKAGSYVNSNPEKGESPSARGQVVIYDLSVKHT